MGTALARAVPFWFDVAPAVLVWLGLMASGMVLCSQPARRLVLGLAACVGAMVIPTLIALDLIPRWEPASWLGPLPLFDGSQGGDFVWLRWALVVYFVGVLWQLAWLGLGWWGGFWLVWSSSAPSSGTIDLFTRLLGPDRKGPRLRISERVRSPALFVGLRSTILVPTALDRPINREALRLALLHELAHDQRQDPSWALLASLCQAFWFFWPPVWWVRAQVRLDQEFLADRQAAADYGSTADYAAALVGQSGPTALPNGKAREAGRARAWFGGSALYQRVLMLLRCPFPVEPDSPFWFRLTTSLFAALTVVGLSTVSLRGFVVGPSGDQADGGKFLAPRVEIGPERDPAPLEFPLPLPDEFELTVRVLADLPEQVAGCRLAGHRVPSPSAPAETGSYHLRLVRTHDVVRLWVDDQEVAVEGPPDPESKWLTVTAPPRQGLSLRELTVISLPEPLDKKSPPRYE